MNHKRLTHLEWPATGDLSTTMEVLARRSRAVNKAMQETLASPIQVVAPVVFQNQNTGKSMEILEDLFLWEHPFAPQFRELIVQGGVSFFVEDMAILDRARDAWVSLAHEGEEADLLPPPIAPYPLFSVVPERIGHGWSQEDEAYEHVRFQEHGDGFSVAAESDEWVMADRTKMRWYLRDGERLLTEPSAPSDCWRLYGLGHEGHEWNARPILSQSLTKLGDNEQYRAVMKAHAAYLLAFLHLLNHRGTTTRDMAPEEVPGRPANRQQRRATGWVDTPAKRIILAPRRSIEATMAQAVRRENVHNTLRAAHQVRQFPRRKPSGGWTVVRPHWRSVKHLSSEERAKLVMKDYDATSRLYHAGE